MKGLLINALTRSSYKDLLSFNTDALEELLKKTYNKQDAVMLARQLATPIDFEELEKAGVIEKKGAWFKIKNLNILPEHALKQIRAITSDGKGNSFVQFPKSWKRAQKLYRQMTGKEYEE